MSEKMKRAELESEEDAARFVRLALRHGLYQAAYDAAIRQRRDAGAALLWLRLALRAVVANASRAKGRKKRP